LRHERTFGIVQSMSAFAPKADIYSEMNHATADCMRNSVGATDRIEFVH
jgi:hypothetical protein